MASKFTVDAAGLSKEQLDLIQKFEADYNAIDDALRKNLNVGKQISFTRLVDDYWRTHSCWKDADLLRMIAEVRNAIVHFKTEAYQYVAVPTPSIVEKLSCCRKRLIKPELVIPTFKRNVVTVCVNDSVAHVLRFIMQLELSQFPVYDDNRFCGLLTENGITRWLAQHVAANLSLIEFEEVPVMDVLRNEEKRKNCQFVSPTMRVDEVCELFTSNLLLEALLISVSGKESEPLQGIVTRWDMIHLA